MNNDYDFYTIKERYNNRTGVIEIFPDFKVCASKDLMLRGKAFYGIWDESKGMWSTNEFDIQQLVDASLYSYAEKYKDRQVDIKVMSSFSSKSWLEFQSYVKHLPDNSITLDESLTFKSDKVSKEDYVSKRLPYDIIPGRCDNYEELISTLYDPKEREKIEWIIGAILSGDSKYIQKFVVFYGDPGTGKSSIINIIQQLFEGYWTAFDAKALAQSSNQFATEVFKSNPLVAIQHDGDLSKVEDNARLNSIVSHEIMTMNEKYKASYPAKVNAFLIMASNKYVQITDAKSGLTRRLIDIFPSGRKLPVYRYNQVVEQIKFELPAIAAHCLEVYEQLGMTYYNDYKPKEMIAKSNPFFNFVEQNYQEFISVPGITLKAAYSIYKDYCSFANESYPLPMHRFREELKNYFEKFEDRARTPEGESVRSYYSGFLADKFESIYTPQKNNELRELEFTEVESILDKELANCPAQYARDDIPSFKWEKVTTTLADIDTTQTHFIKVPENHIIIDFDIKDSEGKKSKVLNLKAASKFPETYGEYSKSGEGVHLHYIYEGDVNRLSRIYDKDIEIKIYQGNSSLRRKLVACNNKPIAHISSGLPLKEEKKKMLNPDVVKNEKMIRAVIDKCLRKEIHASTKPSVDFIYKILEDAYDEKVPYDVTDMRPAVMAFAMQSTHQAQYCLKLVSTMKFKGQAEHDDIPCEQEAPIVFFDVEVFPNLFIICWKKQGKDQSIVRMINPTPEDVKMLTRYRLIGFNIKHYDNHILYGRILGYSNLELFEQSKKIISGEGNGTFAEAYNLSYTDIYDFASAGNKKSLKKWEIELGIKHHELGLPWDQPVAEELWTTVAEYCDDDVRATEALFDHLESDWTARKILADIAGMTVNASTNQLTTKIIFGNNKNPQNEFFYRDMSKPVLELPKDVSDFLWKHKPKMMQYWKDRGDSLLPYFPSYTYSYGKSVYRNEVVGEGGYAKGVPGVYGDVALLDVASMHPNSTISECFFGPRYTEAYANIVYGRVDIKHEAWDVIGELFDGKLLPYIEKVKNGEMSSKQLANALKTAINSVYGLTSARFPNPFKDPRNVDNIVAKRGALFMMTLRDELEKKGYLAAHIKTDSIKIPDATREIVDFVMDFGEKYGYEFEHEATYDRIALMNDAVYIARYATAEKCMCLYSYVPDDNKKKGWKWTATGAQFAQPYLFKTLFSHENIEFKDLCETKAATSSLYLDLNESLPDVTCQEKELLKLQKKDPTSVHIPELIKEIEKGHEYKFVGKVGQFCPVVSGVGGGILVRENKGTYASVSGTKGYRFMETEKVKTLKLEESIDISYYRKFVDDAIDDISQYCNFDWFVNEVEYDKENNQII